MTRQENYFVLHIISLVALKKVYIETGVPFTSNRSSITIYIIVN